MVGGNAVGELAVAEDAAPRLVVITVPPPPPPPPIPGDPPLGPRWVEEEGSGESIWALDSPVIWKDE